MSGWAALGAAAVEPVKRLAAAFAAPASQQSACLFALTATTAGTGCGRRPRSKATAGADDYGASAPAAPYERSPGATQDTAEGRQAVLTADPVVAFEETAGSTSARKL